MAVVAVNASGGRWLMPISPLPPHTHTFRGRVGNNEFQCENPTCQPKVTGGVLREGRVVWRNRFLTRCVAAKFTFVGCLSKRRKLSQKRHQSSLSLAHVTTATVLLEMFFFYRFCCLMDGGLVVVSVSRESPGMRLRRFVCASSALRTAIHLPAEPALPVKSQDTLMFFVSKNRSDR